MYIAEHSECSCLVIDSLEQFKKYDLSLLKNLKAVVFTCALTDQQMKSLTNPYVTCYTWKNFIEIGKKAKVELELHERQTMQQPGNCCNIVYTSGTTGTPKAVMLSHDNMTWITRALRMMFPEVIENGQRGVSFLPLSHIAGQICDIMCNNNYYNILVIIFTKSKCYFARPDALSGSLVDTLKYVNPTTFFAVPRVYEKIEDKIKNQIKEGSSLKQKICNDS